MVWSNILNLFCIMKSFVTHKHHYNVNKDSSNTAQSGHAAQFKKENKKLK